MTTRKNFFCADLSRQNQEQLYGTAPSADFWLLLEYPRTWGTKALKESDLPETVKIYLSSFLKRMPPVRFSFIKQTRTPNERINFFVVRCGESEPLIYRFALSGYEQLLDVDVAALISGQLKGEEAAQDHPLFLICTHGAHDKCCAKHGIPPYEALRRAGEKAVWQSSHVGGDRFAANLVCLPHGLCYGRVDERGAERIVEEYRQGRLYLPNYRGRNCYPKPLQAAEFFVRSETGLTGIDDLRLLDCTDVTEGMLHARFSSGGDKRVHEVALQITIEFREDLSCAGERKNVERYKLLSLSAAVTP